MKYHKTVVSVNLLNKGKIICKHQLLTSLSCFPIKVTTFYKNYSNFIMNYIRLPKNWIIAASKKYPGYVYYFNTKTNETSWTPPSSREYDNVDKTEQELSRCQTMPKPPRKRKTEDAAGDGPSSPEGAPERRKSERRTLRAKRTLPEKTDEASLRASNETPQMKVMRQRILEKQLVKQTKTPSKKGNAVTAEVKVPQEAVRVGLENAKAAEKIKGEEVKDKAKENEKKDEHKEEKSNGKVPMDAETMTPTMKQYYAKMKARKSLAKSKKPDKSPEVPKPEQKQENENGFNHKRTRARSMGPAAKPKPGPSTSYNRRRTMYIPPKSDSDIECISDEDGLLNRTFTTAPQVNKNIAKERIEGLRRSLTAEASKKSKENDSKPPERKRAKKSPEKSSEKLEEKVPSKLSSKTQKLESPSLPNMSGNAETRMLVLKNKLRRESLKLKEESMEATDGSEITSTIQEGSSEAMDWEPIEDNMIMREIEMVRSEIGVGIPMEEQSSSEVNSLDLVDGQVQSKKALYIVIDTNVFLSNLEAVEQARDSVFKTHGRPILVIPWTVIRELDYIKDDRDNLRPESLKFKARHAVTFLHRHFSAKHPRVLGQTARDVVNNRQEFAVECPDDEILQTCLQIQKSQNTAVLMSYDKNLCNKAMIHDVATLGRLDPLEKIDYLMASEYRTESLLASHLKQNGDNPRMPRNTQSKELAMAEDIFEEAKAIIKDFLTVVVAKEMQNLYGASWEKYVIIPPPWTSIAVLKCAIKHWMAAVNDSFARKAEAILKELHDILNKYELNRSLKEVDRVLNLTYKLVQCLVMKKYPKLIERVELAIDDLKKKCDEALAEIQDEDARRGEDQLIRAEAAFKRFDLIYCFARDICGATCDAAGKACAFDYRMFNPPPPRDYLRNIQPELAANLNKLLLVLTTALEDLNVIHKDHPSVVALFDVMESFITIMNTDVKEVTLVDIFFCLKHKEKSLRIGVPQLQGIIEEFCRLAAFRCL